MAGNIPYLPIDQFQEIPNSNIKPHVEGDISAKKQYSDLPLNSSDLGRVSCSYEVGLLLHGMGMEKYTDNFKIHNINLEILKELKEEDLLEIGVLDSEDRKKMHDNLRNKKSFDGIGHPYNTTDDLLIAKNILNQTTLMDSHLRSITNKIEKSDLKDYFLNRETKASDLAKIIINKSVEQTNLICDNIGHPRKRKGLLWTLLENQNLTLPKSDLYKMLKKPKLKYRRIILAMFSTVGVISLAILLSNLLKEK